MIGQVFSFETCVQDDSKLPWEILHTAEIAFEVRCVSCMALIPDDAPTDILAALLTGVLLA